eukprot:scaffold5741_cov203-Ochromonas_danica.AAC.2
MMAMLSSFFVMVSDIWTTTGQAKTHKRDDKQAQLSSAQTQLRLSSPDSSAENAPTTYSDITML